MAVKVTSNKNEKQLRTNLAGLSALVDEAKTDEQKAALTKRFPALAALIYKGRASAATKPVIPEATVIKPNRYEPKLYFQTDGDDGSFYPPDDIGEAMASIELAIEDGELDDYNQGRYEMLTTLMATPPVLLADLFRECLHDILDELMNNSEEVAEELDKEEEVIPMIDACDVKKPTVISTTPALEPDISDEEMLASLAPKTTDEPKHEQSD